MSNVYTCKKCNAPLDITPESIVAICNYCGYPNIISGIISPEDVYIVPSQSRAKIINEFNRLIREDFDLKKIAPYIQIYGIHAFYAPVWTGRVPVRGQISYYKIIREKKKTRRKYYVENINLIENVSLPARRQPMKFGINEAIEHFKITNPKIMRLMDLDRFAWDNIKLEILNTEFDRSEAYRRIKEEALDIIRAKYRSKSDGIDAFICQSYEPLDLKLILLPVWWIYYKYKNSIYYIVFSGWDLKPIIRTEPLTTLRRAVYLLGSIVLLIATPLSILLISSMEEVSLSTLVIPLLLLAGSYYMTNLSLRSIRVER